MELGRIGVWTYQLDLQPAAVARATAVELERLGFRALWISDARRREVFTNAALMLDATRELVVATGIANIYGRDAMTMAFGQKTLCEAFPGRFLLGLGVGHRVVVEGQRGHTYGPPVATMRAYLEAMSRAQYDGPVTPGPCPTILAALGPKMLELSRDRAGGAHPYHTTPAHTRTARRILGTGPLLAPEQSVVFATHAARARAVARSRLRNTLTQPNYISNLRRLGFSEADLAQGGSDALVDGLVAWGDLDAVVRRIEEHLAAGADHVAVQVMSADDRILPMTEWRMLADALRDRLS